MNEQVLPEVLQTEYRAVMDRLGNGADAGLIDEISSLLVKAQEFYHPEQQDIRSFNHVLESYYYDFFINHEEKPYVIAQMNLGLLFRMLGDSFMLADRSGDAIRIYQIALSYNPVDLDTYYSVIEYWKKEEDYEQVRELTQACYPYICTRMDLAKYYRNLGYVYLMEYQPETAEALYEYSQLFYKTDHAEADLVFLEKALARKRKEYTIAELQQLLEQNDIPATANPQTIALTLKVAEAELKEGNRQEAKECYTLVYDITLDADVGELLKSLENES